MADISLCNCCGVKGTCDDVLWPGYIQVGVAGYDYEGDDAVNVPSYFSDVGQAPPGDSDFTTDPDAGLPVSFDGYSFGNFGFTAGQPTVWAPHPRDQNAVQKLLDFVPIIDPRGTAVVQFGENQGKLTGNSFAYPPGDYRVAYCRGAFIWNTIFFPPPLRGVCATLFRSGFKAGNKSLIEHPLYQGFVNPTSKIVYNEGMVSGGSWFLVPEDTTDPLQQFSAGGLGNASVLDMPPLWNGSEDPFHPKSFSSLPQFEQYIRGLQTKRTPLPLGSPQDAQIPKISWPIDFHHDSGGISWWFFDNPYTDNARLSRSPVFILLFKGTEEDYLRLLNPQP